MIVFFVYWEYLWKLLFHFIAVRRLVQERGIEPLFNKVGFHHSNSRCINATPYFNSRFIDRCLPQPLLHIVPTTVSVRYIYLLRSEFGTVGDSPLSISPYCLYRRTQPLILSCNILSVFMCIPIQARATS